MGPQIMPVEQITQLRKLDGARKGRMTIQRPCRRLARVRLLARSGHELTRGHQVQLLNLLRATGLRVGLLLNFGPRPELKRLILTLPEPPLANAARRD